MVKSKLSPRSRFLALRHLNPIHKKGWQSFFKGKNFKLNMTDWHCHVWLTNKAALVRGMLPTFMHRFGWWDFMCTLSPNHNARGENGVYQWRTIYALKSKSAWEMHFPAILISIFNDLVNSKKTQSLGKNGCRQKCLDKSLDISKSVKMLIFRLIWAINIFLGHAVPDIHDCG